MNKLIDYLRELAAGTHKCQEDYPGVGLCSNVVFDVGHVESLKMRTLFREWDEHSGNNTYPVPCPAGGCPRVAFVGACTSGGMWKGAYGDTRKRLCTFLANRLEELNR